VTASFIKELVRRAVLRHAEQGGPLDETVVHGVLAELMAERQTLTRNILGGR
jgi:hypothetical protein